MVDNTPALVGQLALGSALVVGTTQAGGYLARQAASKQHTANALRDMSRGSDTVRNVAMAITCAATVALAGHLLSQKPAASTQKKN